MTDFFVATGVPATAADVVSSVIRSEFTAVQTAFGLVAGYTGNANYVVTINAGATAQTAVQFLTVAQGGTGRATGTTAYGLIAVGTTATGAQQTLPAGATTEILVGGGAAALPVWTTATGSGSPVRATSPALVTPNIGTPSAGVLTSCTGLPATTGITMNTERLLGRSTAAAGNAEEITLGANLSFVGTSLVATSIVGVGSTLYLANNLGGF